MNTSKKSLKIPNVGNHVITIPKAKNRQYNVQKKKEKRTNNDLQSTTQKTKYRASRTPLQPGVISGAPEW
jgi:formylmethanofuran dehydrogenase subunit E